jgi:hypothetical protein
VAYVLSLVVGVNAGNDRVELEASSGYLVNTIAAVNQSQCAKRETDQLLAGECTQQDGPVVLQGVEKMGRQNF